MYEKIFVLLKGKKIHIEKGLTTNEINSIEKFFGFQFPFQLAKFYSKGLPIGEGFYNRRHYDDDKKIYQSINYVDDGIVFDLEHNGFWHKERGMMPQKINDRKEKARCLLRKVPKLIPLYSHRYAIDKKYDTNNVLSIHQSDILCYGTDLLQFFENEFLGMKNVNKGLTYIPFWSDMM